MGSFIILGAMNNVSSPNSKRIHEITFQKQGDFNRISMLKQILYKQASYVATVRTRAQIIKSTKLNANKTRLSG